MDGLSNIISTLSEEEKKEFRTFINRNKQKKKRKDVDLFNLLEKEEDLKPKEIIARLYDVPNKEAYHANRKRLFKHLTDFIVLKNLKENPSSNTAVMGNLTVARHLFNNNSDHMAWKYLLNAEDIAIQNEEYELLNSIYILQIEKAALYEKIDLGLVIRKRNKNKQLADENERATIANSIIRNELIKYRREGFDIDFDRLISTTLKKYELEQIISTRPRMMFNFISIARSAKLAKKDFISFEPYVIGQYKKIKYANGFNKKNHYYKLGFLYMISHTLYRNKRFKESAKYLDELKESLEEFNKGHYAHYYPRYVQLLAATKSFQRNLPEAISLLKDLLATKQVKLTHEVKLNTQVTLAIYHFQNNDLKASRNILTSFYHSDKWCEKVMGREWVMKKNLMEVLLYIDLDLSDLAETRIRALERNYAQLFEHPMYQRVKIFLKLVKEVVLDPTVLNADSFKEKVDASFEWLPIEEEDIQAISFYAWLKSKMERSSFYDALLEILEL